MQSGLPSSCRRPWPLSGHDERITTLLATLAALALAEAERADQMRTALGNRDIIGQAKGILMEHYRLDADAAFSYLSRVAQDANLKILAVARHLVKSGEMPSAPLPGTGTAHGRYTCPPYRRRFRYVQTSCKRLMSRRL